MNEASHTDTDTAWRHLAAAVIMGALADLHEGRRGRSADAVEWINSREFESFLGFAGCEISVSACRSALRRRGIMPPTA